MATNAGGREERRRRITERGSDRMALITRRMQSFPSSSASIPSPSNHHLSEELLSTDFYGDQHPENIGMQSMVYRLYASFIKDMANLSKKKKKALCNVLVLC